MIRSHRLAAAAVVALSVAGCARFNSLTPTPLPSRAAPAAPAALPPGALLPSANLLVGRVIAIDAERGFAFVELAADVPAEALVDGAELRARTDALRETARLRASRHLRGRTLGTTIIAGRPAPGDEIVFPAP
ncbi:MAG: hypothetical protein RLZZ15_3095 [Verrucomicrobiota bacterium]|jgi:hypothetical protein